MTGNQAGRRKVWGWAAAILAVLLAVFAVNAAQMLVIDAPERSDVILVLAGDTDRRPAKGLELLENGYGRRVILDVPAAEKTFGFTDIELARKFAESWPHPEAVKLCAITALSTREESHEAEKCLAQEDGSRVLIVTSDFHTRRALSIFRHEIRGKTFSMTAAWDDREFGVRWWTRREWAKTCLYEWMRLAWWNSIDRWR